jgi:hypothetical protein
MRMRQDLMNNYSSDPNDSTDRTFLAHDIADSDAGTR